MKIGSRRRACVGCVAVALVGLVALAAPARAGPAPRRPPEVTLKAGLNDPKDPNIAVLEFLPESVKVATGTTVTWEIAGPEPHSVTFVPPGTDVPPSAETRTRRCSRPRRRPVRTTARRW